MKLKKNPKTGIYSVRFSTPHGRRVMSTGATNRAEAMNVVAEAKIAELEKSARIGRLTAQTVSQILVGRNVTVAQAIGMWVQWMRRHNKPRTAAQNKQLVGAWARATKAMGLAPAAVTEAHIDRWVNDPAATTKLGSRKVKLAALRSFFGYCWKKGICLSNPAALVEVNLDLLSQGQKETKVRQAFTDKEVKLLLRSTSGFWHYAVALGRYAGLRLGDICRLEWEAFAKPGHLVVWTDKRDRRVELVMDAQLSEIVAEIPYRHRTHCFPEQRKVALEPSKRAKLSVQFGRLCQRLEIQGRSFHCLRMSYAQACQRQGIPMPHIALRLGHAQLKTTQVYTG